MIIHQGFFCGAKSKVILRLNASTMGLKIRGEKGRDELGFSNMGSAPFSDFTNQDDRHRLASCAIRMDTADPCE
jgi:hypothetical protein